MLFRLIFLVSIALAFTSLNAQDSNIGPSSTSSLIDSNKPQDVDEKEPDDTSDRITRYNGIYAIAGEPNTKIQISLKYKIMSAIDLYIGYTQTMFWDIGKKSSPFNDINFNPDLFYRINFPEHTFVKAIDLGLFEHKSNGKDGDNSRAWSGNYLKIHTLVKFYSWSFNWDTKLYCYQNYSVDSTNWDIREYSGFWEMKFSFINYYDPKNFIDRATLYFSFFPGGKYSQHLSKGGQEIGLKFRMGWGIFNPSMFFQFYHGYNESLIDYNKSFTSYRIGLAF